MKIDPDDILSVLDQCCDSFTFPMLDNGYFYLAGTRLALYRSDTDWAMVIETFGYSPRAGLPSTYLQTFASRLHDRDLPEHYVSRRAYEKYLAENPYNDSRSVYPVHEGPWQDVESLTLLSECAKEVRVRGRVIPLPHLDAYADHGINLERAPRVQVFELCRYLADVSRAEVLATSQERRVSILPDMVQLLQLEEWHHPNVVDEEERPSGSATFRQLAMVLATGDVTLYRPTQAPNTHWRNWPEGGRL